MFIIIIILAITIQLGVNSEFERGGGWAPYPPPSLDYAPQLTDPGTIVATFTVLANQQGDDGGATKGEREILTWRWRSLGCASAAMRLSSGTPVRAWTQPGIAARTGAGRTAHALSPSSSAVEPTRQEGGTPAGLLPQLQCLRACTEGTARGFTLQGAGPARLGWPWVTVSGAFAWTGLPSGCFPLIRKINYDW